MAESKQCAICNGSFGPTPGRSRAQWAKQTCCSRRCANTAKARAQRVRPFGASFRQQRQAAQQWETQRRREDRVELSRKPDSGLCCRLSAKPKPRLFISRVCRGCGAMWVSYAARHDTDYCSPCNERRWRHDCNHQRRIRLMGARREVVSADEVFKRDGWRCQLCGRLTRGVHPALTAPTLDHIVPLSQGGEHSYRNTQCACMSCNSRKGANAANDQLRLVG